MIVYSSTRQDVTERADEEDDDEEEND